MRKSNVKIKVIREENLRIKGYIFITNEENKDQNI